MKGSEILGIKYNHQEELDELARSFFYYQKYQKKQKQYKRGQIRKIYYKIIRLVYSPIRRFKD